MSRRNENLISTLIMLANFAAAIFVLGYMLGVKLHAPASPEMQTLVTTLLVVLLANVGAVFGTYRFRRRRGF